MQKKKKKIGIPTYPLRRSWASKLIDKPISAHLYEFPLRILVKAQEARNQPYSSVLDFEVVAILKATTTTVEEVYVVVGES